MRLNKETIGRTRGVAIIDSGLDRSHEALLHPAGGIHIQKTAAGTFCYSEDVEDEKGHGTAICGIVSSYKPSALFIVKLSSFDGIVTEDLLVEGIRWCVTCDEVGVINISMGISSKHYSRELYEICRSAHRRKKIIVAAVHNNPYEECYPAFFSFAIGVAAGFAAKGKFRWLRPGCGVNVLAGGVCQRVAWMGNIYRRMSGTSLACAHFTGVLSEMLRDGDFSSLSTFLARGSSDPGIIPVKFFLPQQRPWLPCFRPTGDYLQTLSALEGKKIAMYPASDPDIRYLYRCWTGRSANEINLLDTSDQWKKIKAALGMVGRAGLVMVSNFVPSWKEEVVIGSHRLIREALKNNMDMLLPDQKLVNLAAEYIRLSFSDYKGTIYTNTFPERRQSAAGQRSRPAGRMNLALVGFNIHDDAVVRAWRRLHDTVSECGISSTTVATNHYQHFFGTDQLVFEQNPYYSGSEDLKKQYLKRFERAGGEDVSLLLLNEEMKSHREWTFQLRLKALGQKLEAFAADKIILITNDDVEKDDLRRMLEMLYHRLPGKLLFAGYWSHRFPHPGRNYRLSFGGQEQLLPVLNLDNEGNGNVFRDLLLAGFRSGRKTP